MHLPSASASASRRKQQLLAERPETQQPDAELALQLSPALGLEPALDRIAHVRGDVVEIRLAIGIAAHAFAVVLDAQIVLALVLPARDDHRFRTGVDAVFDELRDSLQRIALR